MFLNQANNKLGYWSPITSIIDWCEPNYQHFDTVAETYNTFSSIAYLIFGVCFIYTIESLYRTNEITRKLRLPRIYLEIIVALIVGIGTYLFHMTLHREHQMLDELSMNGAILVHLYCLINMDDEEKGKSEEGWKKAMQCFGLFHTSKAAISAVCCLTLFSISFIVYDTMIPVVFQTLFGISVLCGIMLSSVQAAKKYEMTDPVHTPHFQKAKKDKIILLSMGVGIGALGFTVWLIDNNTCPKYEHLKLHAVWHLCTALAVYIWGMFALHCHCTDKFARQLNCGETTVQTKVVYFPLPALKFVKVIEGSKSHEE